MNASVSVIFIASFSLAAEYASAISMPIEPGVEILADGNKRDPIPSSQAIANLAEDSTKNMIRFPAGSFDMGDWGPRVNPNELPFDNRPDSKPVHKVTLNSFSIGKYIVTYREFDLFTAAKKLPRINQNELFLDKRTPYHPAGASWQGAKDYCLWLGEETKMRFDLPSEAQWEYAARSGGKYHVFPTNTGLLDEETNVPSYAQRKADGGRKVSAKSRRPT